MSKHQISGNTIERQVSTMSESIGKVKRYRPQFTAVLGILVLLFVAAANGHLHITNLTSNGKVQTIPSAIKGKTHVASPADDWSMYLHDFGHTGYNTAEQIINPSSVGSLKPRWIHRVGGEAGVTLSTQPVVAFGLVYWGAWDGYEHATDPAKPNKDVWTAYLGKTEYNANCSPSQVGVASTATVASVNIGGTMTPVLFVGGGNGTFYALNARTGQVIWSRPFGSVSQGYFLWSSPYLWRGDLYIGVASWGDCPLIRGKVVKLNASDGTLEKTWYAVPADCTGAGVWSSITIDQEADKLYFATGTWSLPTPPCSINAQSMVELTADNLSFLGSWQPPMSEEVDDGDFGAGAILFTATIGGTVHYMVGAENKNGIFYAFERDHISRGPVWRTRLSTAGTNVGVSAWDGTYLYLVGNDTKIHGKSCDGSLRAVDPATGAFVWRDCLSGGRINGSVTLVPGLAVVGVGSTLYAVATTTTAMGTPGKVLFSYQDTSYHWFYAGPTISNGVLYAVNSDGNFYAFTIKGQ